MEDKDCLVRAACAQVLPTLCNLIWQENSFKFFGSAFGKLLRDPNPFVLQHLLTQVELIIEAFEDKIAEFSSLWVSIAETCSSRGCWRLSRLYYEKTRLIVKYLG